MHSTEYTAPEMLISQLNTQLMLLHTTTSNAKIMNNSEILVAIKDRLIELQSI